MSPRLVLAGAVILSTLLLGATTEARHAGRSSYGGSHRHHGGHYGRHHGHHRYHHHRYGHGFHGFGGSAFWYPFYYPYPYYYRYYAPYPAYSYPYLPPPPEEPLARADEPDAESDDEEDRTAPDPLRASYGLVQLQGIPDGAKLELDGRFWLTAEILDRRWLALPQGEHVLTARVQGGEPVERRVEIVAGKTQVVRFAFPR